MPLIAYAWASGLIEFGTKLPDGALPVASSCNEKALTETIEVLARHGYKKGELLVPGIPEAGNQNEARIALTRFNFLVEQSLLTGVKNG
ncbi:host nuclease inhibitor protein [Salmonella enterica]|nr:host nuclease inhibitor protein [Salmonella enterica]